MNDNADADSFKELDSERLVRVLLGDSERSADGLDSTDPEDVDSGEFNDAYWEDSDDRDSSASGDWDESIDEENGNDPGMLIALAAAGGANDDQADAILANEYWRIRLGKLWSMFPPTESILQQAAQNSVGPTMRLIREVLLPLQTPAAEDTRHWLLSTSFEETQSSQSGELDRLNLVAMAAIGRVDGNDAFNVILANINLRSALADTWEQAPPDRQLLARALSEKAQGREDLWRLLDEVFLNGESDAAVRAKDQVSELQGWLTRYETLNWFTRLPTGSLVDLTVRAVKLPRGRFQLQFMEHERLANDLQVAVFAWFDHGPEPIAVVGTDATAMVEVPWPGRRPQAWSAIGRRVAADPADLRPAPPPAPQSSPPTSPTLPGTRSPGAKPNRRTSTGQQRPLKSS